MDRYEVRIVTYTRVVAENEADARKYAEALIATVDTEQVEAFGEFHAFRYDEITVVEDDDGMVAYG